MDYRKTKDSQMIKKDISDKFESLKEIVEQETQIQTFQ